MTREENIFFARRNAADFIWKLTNTAGIDADYAEVSMVCDGFAVKGMTIQKLRVLEGLKNGLEFIIKSSECSMNLELVYRINEIITGSQGFSDSLSKQKLEEALTGIAGIDDSVEKSVCLMIFLMGNNIFSEGNIQTAILAANQIMIHEGAGMISIPLEIQQKFKNELEKGDADAMKKLATQNCISSMEFPSLENKELEEFDKKLEKFKKDKNFEKFLRKNKEKIIKIATENEKNILDD